MRNEELQWQQLWSGSNKTNENIFPYCKNLDSKLASSKLKCKREFEECEERDTKWCAALNENKFFREKKKPHRDNVWVEMKNVMESGDDSWKLMTQKNWSDGRFMEIESE